MTRERAFDIALGFTVGALGELTSRWVTVACLAAAGVDIFWRAWLDTRNQHATPGRHT